MELLVESAIEESGLGRRFEMRKSAYNKSIICDVGQMGIALEFEQSDECGLLDGTGEAEVIFPIDRGIYKMMARDRL